MALAAALVAASTTLVAPAAAATGASARTSTGTSVTDGSVAARQVTVEVRPRAQDDGTFAVDTATSAYAAWRAATGAAKEQLAPLALTPTARWLTQKDPAVARADALRYTTAARDAGRTALVVLYAIPDRDCGSYSAGGTSAEAYGAWVRTVATGLVGDVWVVLEPDALAMVDRCGDGETRLRLLRQAAADLTAAGARVYVDAGHARWMPAATAAARLRAVGVENLAGFALNTSNFYPTADNVTYGRRVVELLGGGHFVVDTSRNGAGHNGQWCNPPGRAIGAPTQRVPDVALDALLWIKHPGHSDGTCNGGPPAGTWWPDQARDLVATAAGRDPAPFPLVVACPPA
ncbi:glycoside hydrolase family 6 protein [Cellulomonas marina]|uniref:Glucanase n=1 Tax=Cellulomonas marina TaxID=988821 RepID=A0A1I0X280_9CELL|nr:glycoside hydrolase family 6 protein [Cellulomonas marina]SFA95085.1 endoglucanase [Cellulomonas marina]